MSAYSAVVLADNPVAYYRMDEASGLPQDSSGNGNHTTVASGSQIYSEHSAITTDPDSSSILMNGQFTAPDSSTLRVGDVFTLECWAQRDNTGAFIDVMFSKAGGGYGLNWNSDKLMLSKSGTSQIANSSTTVTDTTTFHHCVATKSGSTIHLYIDGVDVTGVVTNATCVDNTDLLCLGDEIGSGFTFDGWLQEVAVYPTALTSSQVLSHYYAGISNYSAEVLTDGPVAYYRMNEASGLIQDSSGNGNHATSSTGAGGYQVASPITTDPTDHCIDFNGATSYSVDDNATLDLGDVLTAEAWITSSDWDHGPTTHVISGRGTGALTWGVDQSTHTIFAAKADVALICSSTIALSTQTWYHVVYTKNGSTSHIYINSVDVTDTVTNATLADVANSLVIGGDYNGTSFRMYGAMDELAFYSTELSPARVLAHYQAAFDDLERRSTRFMDAIGW